MPLELIKKSSANKNVQSHNFICVDIFQMNFTGSLDDKDFQEFKLHFNKCLKNESPFGAIFNLSNVINVQPDLIIKQLYFSLTFNFCLI